MRIIITVDIISPLTAVVFHGPPVLNSLPQCVFSQFSEVA